MSVPPPPVPAAAPSPSFPRLRHLLVLAAFAASAMVVFLPAFWNVPRKAVYLQGFPGAFHQSCSCLFVPAYFLGTSLWPLLLLLLVGTVAGFLRPASRKLRRVSSVCFVVWLLFGFVIEMGLGSGI